MPVGAAQAAGQRGAASIASTAAAQAAGQHAPQVATTKAIRYPMLSIDSRAHSLPVDIWVTGMEAALTLQAVQPSKWVQTAILYGMDSSIQATCLALLQAGALPSWQALVDVLRFNQQRQEENELGELRCALNQLLAAHAQMANGLDRLVKAVSRLESCAFWTGTAAEQGARTEVAAAAASLQETVAASAHVAQAAAPDQPGPTVTMPYANIASLSAEQIERAANHAPMAATAASAHATPTDLPPAEWAEAVRHLKDASQILHEPAAVSTPASDSEPEEPPGFERRGRSGPYGRWGKPPLQGSAAADTGVAVTVAVASGNKLARASGHV